MPKFYVTFGQKYAHEQHPRDSRVHPDGYVLIRDAADENDAYEKAHNAFGPFYAFCYNAPPSARLYPRGQLFEI